MKLLSPTIQKSLIEEETVANGKMPSQMMKKLPLPMVKAAPTKVTELLSPMKELPSRKMGGASPM